VLGKSEPWVDLLPNRRPPGVANAMSPTRAIRRAATPLAHSLCECWRLLPIQSVD
jgi:hypothetical protein